MEERRVSERTESDMREQGKHSIRSAGYIDRHVIVHRSADRGALWFTLSADSLLAWGGGRILLHPPLRFWVL